MVLSLAPSEMEVVIHAGTHKTASSYIQSRMAANRDRLAAMGLSVPYPSGLSRKHKPLASALVKGRWQPWQQLLQGGRRLLLSGEQFTQPLAQAAILDPLVELLASGGFRLRVVVFLRDQPDYMNARYVHSTRRLYHHQDFEGYVSAQLAERRRVYDYNYLFSSLIGHPGVTCMFLPYGSGFGDPFVRMMEALGWAEPPQGWAPADPDKGNVQPGCRGVWLAQAVGQRLDSLGLKGRKLVNTGAVVRRIAVQQGWQDDRYCGFDRHAAAAVAHHYAAANNAFAQRVWGCRWRERVPEVLMERRVYLPPQHGEERRRLESLVDQALQDLARQNPRLRRALNRDPSTIKNSPEA